RDDPYDTWYRHLHLRSAARSFVQKHLQKNHSTLRKPPTQRKTIPCEALYEGPLLVGNREPLPPPGCSSSDPFDSSHCSKTARDIFQTALLGSAHPHLRSICNPALCIDFCIQFPSPPQGSGPLLSTLRRAAGTLPFFSSVS